jgi:hypothetical protein
MVRTSRGVRASSTRDNNLTVADGFAAHPTPEPPAARHSEGELVVLPICTSGSATARPQRLHVRRTGMFLGAELGLPAT